MSFHRLLIPVILAAPFLVRLTDRIPGGAGLLPAHADTGIAEHLTDGIIDEWPAGRFSSDKSSGIAYAIDNDDHFLYVALSIPQIPEQFRISRSGMKLFIDPNGRKRESRGIEYPIRREGGGSFGSFRGSRPGAGEPGSQPGWKEGVSSNLFTYRLFGYEETDEAEKAIDADGDLHIAFQWDDSGALHIEYQLPLTRISENVAGLYQKTIGLGWKINGSERPAEASFGTGVPAGPGGGRRGATNPASSNFGGAAGNRGNVPASQSSVPAQVFWSRYPVVLSTE